MTTVADVISQALIIIDDKRMQRELAVDPALFYRRYSAYLETAIQRTTKPPQLYQYISSNYVPPTYTDYEWVSTEESIGEPTTIATGKAGFELCSCTVLSDDGMSVTAYNDFVYDEETGDITMAAQVEAGVQYDFNFYTDGYFEKELTPRMQSLLAMAFGIVWDERFTRNWLNMQPKIKDASFETINEANYMDKLTDRMTQNRQNFSDEIRSYEQDFAYRNIVGGIKPTDVFI